jgi:protein gp37
MSDSPHRFASKYEREGVVVLRGRATKPGLTYTPSERVPLSERRGRNIIERHGDDSVTVSLGKGAQWTGEVRLLPWALDVPLRRKKPTTYFVNSLSDVFHESIVDREEGRRFIAAMFGVMAASTQHTFQLLTKRPEKAREWFAWLANNDDVDAHAGSWRWTVPGQACRCHLEAVDALKLDSPGKLRRVTTWPLPNVWIGTSVEDHPAADERRDPLVELPAAVRFLSCEPLLEDLGDVDLSGIDWVIVGGESGRGARPCDVAWIRSIVEQSREAGVACFVKQLGSHVLSSDDFPSLPSIDGRVHLDHSKGGDIEEWPEDLRVREMPTTAGAPDVA